MPELLSGTGQEGWRDEGRVGGRRSRGEGGTKGWHCTAERAPEEKICCGISERERETKKNREERLVVFCPGRKKEIKKESKKKEATVIEKRTKEEAGRMQRKTANRLPLCRRTPPSRWGGTSCTAASQGRCVWKLTWCNTDWREIGWTHACNTRR